MKAKNMRLKQIISDGKFQAAAQLGQLTPEPVVKGISTIISVISSLASQSYQDDRLEAKKTFDLEISKRFSKIEQSKIDINFLNSREGVRLLAHIMRIIYKDSRKEKIIAATHLTTKLILSSKLTIDEKELFVETLDRLNVLQLSVLESVVYQMWARSGNPHRGFGWESLANEYEKRGVKKSLLLQSISTIESLGLVNKNHATVTTKDQTHFITEFGEEFVRYCTEINTTPNVSRY